VSEIKIAFAFGIPPERPTPNIAPSWNLAPTDPAPIVYYDARDGGRRLEVMIGPKTSRSASRPSMRGRRRSTSSRRFAKRSSASAAWCHSTAFYEWKKTASGKQP